MWKRIAIFFILTIATYYVGYKIERNIEDKSWGGFGVVEVNGKILDKESFRRSLANLEFSYWRMYAYYEMVDCVFCFLYSMLLCDFLTICFAKSPKIIQILDLTPFLLGIIDFCENVTIIWSIIQWPYGFSQQMIEFGVFFSSLKITTAKVVLGVVIFGVVNLLFQRLFFKTSKKSVQQKTKSKTQ